MKIAHPMCPGALSAKQIRQAAKNMRGDCKSSERLSHDRYVWRLQLHKKSAEALSNDRQRIRDTTGFNYDTQKKARQA